MSNKPFDQRIIHPLERPSAGDLNIALSQLGTTIRNAMRLMTSRSGATLVGGAFSDGFKPLPPASASLAFRLEAGALSPDGVVNSETNIGNIYGLNNQLYYRLAYLYTRKSLTVQPVPAAGFCRRDFIYVRPLTGANEHLTDYTSTDIYDPGVNSFIADSKPKTMTLALDAVTPSVVEYGGTFDEANAIVYAKGSEVPYANDNSYLSSLGPSSLPLASGYTLVAIVNLKSDTTAITAANLVDARKLLAPYGHLTLVGEADVGASGGIAGAHLSNVSIEAPPSLRASIYKLGADQTTKTNSYVLAVFGPQNVTKAVANIDVGIPLSIAPSNAFYPASVMTWEPLLNQTVDAEHAAFYANSSKASPTQTVAVGQTVHYFPFTVGRITTTTAPQTVSVNLSSLGSITIPDATSNYPAGTYTVNSTDVFRKYQMVWNVPAEEPTAGLFSPTYALKSVNESPDGAIWIRPNLSTSVRIAGFVTDAGDPNLTVLPGQNWQLDVWSSWNYNLSSDRVYLKVEVYSYDGTNDPEAAPPIAQSDDIPIALGNFNADPVAAVPAINKISLKFVENAAFGADSRIYVRLSARAEVDATVPKVYVYFTTKYPCILTTSLPTTSSVTIGDPPNYPAMYPAGTYPVSGTSGTITVDLPGVPKFDPSAQEFATTLGLPISTIPVRFTVNMVV